MGGRLCVLLAQTLRRPFVYTLLGDSSCISTLLKLSKPWATSVCLDGFAESGLFFGFFLPGDSLLLTAGLLASQGKLELAMLLIILPIAAILGDSVGYWFGKKTGPRIFSRDDSLLFRRKNLLAAQTFYERHGGKTIVLARFMPFIRTFAPIVAGAAEMRYSRFLFFNVVGGLLWGIGVTRPATTWDKASPTLTVISWSSWPRLSCSRRCPS